MCNTVPAWQKSRAYAPPCRISASCAPSSMISPLWNTAMRRRTLRWKAGARYRRRFFLQRVHRSGGKARIPPLGSSAAVGSSSTNDGGIFEQRPCKRDLLPFAAGRLEAAFVKLFQNRRMHALEGAYPAASLRPTRRRSASVSASLASAPKQTFSFSENANSR